MLAINKSLMGAAGRYSAAAFGTAFLRCFSPTEIIDADDKKPRLGRKTFRPGRRRCSGHRFAKRAAPFSNPRGFPGELHKSRKACSVRWIRVNADGEFGNRLTVRLGKLWWTLFADGYDEKCALPLCFKSL